MGALLVPLQQVRVAEAIAAHVADKLLAARVLDEVSAQVRARREALAAVLARVRVAAGVPGLVQPQAD